MESKHACPECHLVFESPTPPNGALTCPLCNCTFALQAPSQPLPTSSSPRPDGSGRQVVRGAATVAVLVLLVMGGIYAYHLINHLGHKHVSAAIPETHVPSVVDAHPVPVEIIEQSSPPQTPVSPSKTTALSRRPRPSVVSEQFSRPLTLEERVNAAIDSGLKFLLNQHKNHKENLRYLPLVGLTLLECGVSNDDPWVRDIAASIRARERTFSQTYDLTLAILFLDRFGDARDRALIRNFGKRLIDGQLECGAWSYSCLLNERRRYPEPAPSGIPSIPPLPGWPNTSPARGQPGRPGRGGMPGHTGRSGRPRITYRGDNSNTQFAILGLWVAQRHGLPARTALLTTEQYFRDTQHEDGSWAYHPAANNWRDSMTCAGLMSLAMRYGVTSGHGGDLRPTQRINVRDPAVLHGLRYLAESLDRIACTGHVIVGVDAREPFYFLWSLERMAVIYDLKKIGNREWYPWAAEMLVETQRQDGLWNNVVDTCFALLILKRSNFAQDLQLAVQQPPSPPKGEGLGPTIIQGRDAIEELTNRPVPSPAPPSTTSTTTPPSTLGPSITRTPQKK
jgi:hypothetical protein